VNQQLVHLIIVLIIVGGSVMKVIFTKLQEQAVKRRAQQAAEHRRLEALRTGRESDSERPIAPSVTVAQTSGTDLQDLARKRAAQLAELRRMQQARHRSGSPMPRPASPGEVILRVPGSSGPTVPGTRSAPLPAPVGRTARPAPRPAPPARQTSPDRRPQSRPQKAPKAQPKSYPEDAPTPRRSAPAPTIERDPLRLAMAAPEADAPPRQRPLLASPSTTDWRRAILMSEILSPPLATRSIDTSPLARRF